MKTHTIEQDFRNKIDNEICTTISSIFFIKMHLVIVQTMLSAMILMYETQNIQAYRQCLRRIDVTIATGIITIFKVSPL